MGVTNFPDGINIGSEAGATAAFQVGGAAVYPIGGTANSVKISVTSHTITGAGTVATGLTTCALAHGALGGTVAGIAGTAAGNPWIVRARATTGGSAIIQVFDATGAAASNAGTVTLTASGT